MSTVPVHVAARLCLLASLAVPLLATPEGGGSGTVEGVVTDPTGAAVPAAAVEIRNPLTGFQRSAITDTAGAYRFPNVPPNPYHLSVSARGFAPVERDIEVRSAVPVPVDVQLALASETSEVTVHAESEHLIEDTPTQHTDLDRGLMAKLPIASPGAGLSDAIALGAPGVVADSNGMFHPLGEHAGATIVLDGQPIPDQQSKSFSNQLALNSIQSMEVISGVPPAEYGDKSGLVVNAMSRSGLGLGRPVGGVSAQYGSFGTWSGEASLALGSPHWGNLISLSSAGSGRYLDTPEFWPQHAHGATGSVFDHFDFQRGENDSFHLNVSAARSWFQIPNTYDQQTAGQDQRQRIRSMDFAPSWTHLFGATTLFTLTPYFRQDLVRYFPSRDPFSDRPATLGQQRRLTNFGARGGFSYVRGVHNAKIGFDVKHYLLSENFSLGITDPAFNAPGSPGFNPGLLPFDLTRGGALFRFRGRAGIQQEAFFVQDSITLGRFNVMLGLRGDNYNGLSADHAAEPRLGLSYFIKRTSTVLRASYGRLFETPYNENLVLSSSTGAGGLAVNAGAFNVAPLRPGTRNQFNVGLQQTLGKHILIDGEYFWKYADRASDFDALLNTPLTFPIEWRKSKIDGLALRVNLVNVRGVTALHRRRPHPRALLRSRDRRHPV
jgi:hypothetical protein